MNTIDIVLTIFIALICGLFVNLITKPIKVYYSNKTTSLRKFRLQILKSELSDVEYYKEKPLQLVIKLLKSLLLTLLLFMIGISLMMLDFKLEYETLTKIKTYTVSSIFGVIAGIIILRLQLINRIESSKAKKRLISKIEKLSSIDEKTI